MPQQGEKPFANNSVADLARKSVKSSGTQPVRFLWGSAMLWMAG
jgi:hypothetical protein